MTTQTVEDSSALEKLTGCVKWFNNKQGYGFLNVTSGEKSGTDLFVHHSAIQVETEQYKYLVQGEYVEFDVQKMESKNEHEHQAVNITGIMNGDLMCETRFKNKDLSRVRDGFAPPRRVRASDRGERGGDRPRGRPQNRSREERITEN